MESGGGSSGMIGGIMPGQGSYQPLQSGLGLQSMPQTQQPQPAQPAGYMPQQPQTGQSFPASSR